MQHVGTKKNLHSHYFTSPLSGNQEVSCYGDEDGEGDSGDNWTVVCNNDYWRRDSAVKLRHVDTAAWVSFLIQKKSSKVRAFYCGLCEYFNWIIFFLFFRYLAGSGRTFGRPISGQGEVVGVTGQYGAYTDWQAQEGLFIHPSDNLPHMQHAIHTEL